MYFNNNVDIYNDKLKNRKLKNGKYIRETILEKFFEIMGIYSNSDECWEWKGRRFSNNYGCLNFGLKNFLAHRISYEIYYGENPGNLLVCHTCDNPPCVNPKHLFLGTYKDNAKDCIDKNRKNPKIGEDKWNRKLCDEDIINIRNLYKLDGHTAKDLSEKYNVDITIIRKIANGIIWKHIRPLNYIDAQKEI